jgi:hypothetical protein
MISGSSQNFTLVNPIKNKSPSQHILSSGTQSPILARLKFGIFVNAQSTIQIENGRTLHIELHSF